MYIFSLFHCIGVSDADIEKSISNLFKLSCQISSLRKLIKSCALFFVIKKKYSVTTTFCYCLRSKILTMEIHKKMKLVSALE